MKKQYSLIIIMIFLINLGTLLSSLACPNCPNQTLLPRFPFRRFPFRPRLPRFHSSPPPPPRIPFGFHKSPPTPYSSHLPIRPIDNLPSHPLLPTQLSPQVCHVDPFKLGACVDLLGGFVDHLKMGKKVKKTCCPMIEVLADTEAAFCLCSAMKKKYGKDSLIIPTALDQVLASCDKSLPPAFHCAA